MKVGIIGAISIIVVFFIIALTGSNFENKLKEQMNKKDENFFILKARNLHNLAHVLGALVLFLTAYFAEDFRDKPGSTVVLVAFGLLLLGTLLYTIRKALVRIEYRYGKITYYFLNIVKAQGNINEVDIDKCVNAEHPKNIYETWLLYKDTTIVFNDGSSISYQTSMKNAYKLEAILKKKGCFQYSNIK